MTTRRPPEGGTGNEPILESAPLAQTSRLTPLSASPAESAPARPSHWPYLAPDILEQRWQQAIEQGPRMAGRQVAYALAASLQAAPVSKHDLPPLPKPAEATSGLLAATALSEHLTMQARIDLFHEALALPDPVGKARALFLLAAHLSGETRRRAIGEAYQAALQVAHPVTRVELLVELLPLLRSALENELPSGMVAETLDLAAHMQSPEARLRALTALTPHLPPTIRVAVLLAELDTIAALSQSDLQAGALVALAPHLTAEVHHRALTVAAHVKDPSARARSLTALAEVLPAELQPRLRAAALEAIATVSNEEDRARALAAFAPHLEAMTGQEEEFPLLLKRALEIAVNMHQRAARARAMVGLHGRLPRELHGEALAAVNAIQDEHVRAQLLAEIAPGLPGDMSVAAMAVAHDIRQRDARYLAFKALAEHLPQRAADRTWQDALALALALPRQLERVLALAEIAPHLQDDLAARTLNEALSTARSIPKERARVRALSTLAPLLVPYQQALADCLADAHTLGNPFEKVSALIALLPYLPEGDAAAVTINEILNDLRGITVEYRRARALASVVPHLPPTSMGAAAEIALDITDPYDRATTLVAFLPYLAGEAHAGVLESAWTAAGEITDHYDRAMALVALWGFSNPERQAMIIPVLLDAVREIQDEYDRASGISVVAPLLAADTLPTAIPSEAHVLREALLATSQVPDTSLRGTLLARLVPLWTQVQPASVAYSLWCEILLLLSRRPVPDLLSDVSALVPVLLAIGGPAAAREATEAVTAARRWKVVRQ